jgi:hypothetical protein
LAQVSFALIWKSCQKAYSIYKLPTGKHSKRKDEGHERLESAKSAAELQSLFVIHPVGKET